MFLPNFTDLKEIFRKRGYPFYAVKGFYNLCIVGVRSNESQSNKFDDFVGVAYQNGNMVAQMEWYPATTDPGKYYLQSPVNREGTLIMVPGYHERAYQKGLHGRGGKNPYTALEQVAPMKYVRDNNKDMTLDFSLYRDPEKLKDNLVTGIFKTNIHRASQIKILSSIEQYSAGCQVIQKLSDFQKLMTLVDKQIGHGHGDIFSYTLLEETDLK
jgi:hypothetical protein